VAASDVRDAGKVASADEGDERLSTLRHRFTVAMSAYSDTREDELDDLRFMAGSPDNQWQWPAAGQGHTGRRERGPGGRRGVRRHHQAY
jgi:hypothetical protein